MVLLRIIGVPSPIGTDGDTLQDLVHAFPVQVYADRRPAGSVILQDRFVPIVNIISCRVIGGRTGRG